MVAVEQLSTDLGFDDAIEEEACTEITPLVVLEDGNVSGSDMFGCSNANESLINDDEETDDGENTDDDDGRVAVEIHYSTPDGKSHKLNKESGLTPPPTVGMVFNDWEAVESYFRSYAKQQGFGIVRAHGSYRQRNGKSTGERRTVTWNCEWFGKKDTRQRVNGKKVKMNALSNTGVKFATRKSKKCECPVTVYAGVRPDGDWEIRKVVLEHSGHSLAPSKSKFVSMFRQDEIDKVVRKKLFAGLEVGVKLPLIHRALAKERNGLANTSFTERDLRNVVSKHRRKKIADGGGDANAMVNYFKKMKEDDENFFHVERVDEIDRLKDVMWVDGRSRAAYKEFSDVVCFDTTYLTNKFKLAFGNFVGVNHHGQTTLFGCALLSHENSETFEWLFSTWLRCMGGVSPRGFLTDQCPAMRKALRNVMPETRHRWCLWHILQKFSGKLGSYAKYEDFKVELNNIIYDSLTAAEFKESWLSTIDKYDLQDDEWLSGLFNQAEMWVPAYMKHIFWAGMKTTQRCESINSFFDGYVQRQTMLHEFGPQYFAAIEARIDAEEKADADCERNLLEPVSDFRIELEFQKVYTSAKFYEFQIECMKVMYVHVPKQRQLSDELIENKVEDRIWYRDKNLRKDVPTEKTCEYTVILNVKTTEAWCTCKLLECHGIMCRHLVKVFDVQKIRKLPSMFILDRWRKDIERPYTKIKLMYHDPEKTCEVERLDRLQLVFDTVAMLASEYEDDTEKLIRRLEEHREKLIQTRAEASRSKAGENCLTTTACKDLCNLGELTRSKQDENTICVGQGKDKDSTPPSVGNKKRLLDDSGTPPSVKKICAPICVTTPGAAESVGAIGDECVPTKVPTPSAAGSIGVVGNHEVQEVPDVIKDPPLPKNPRHRPIESRFKSAVELNTTAKGKGKGGAGRGKRGQAKQLEECTLQLQQQQAKLDLFLQQQASFQQATLERAQQRATIEFHQQQQQLSAAYGWVNFPLGTVLPPQGLHQQLDSSPTLTGSFPAHAVSSLVGGPLGNLPLCGPSAPNTLRPPPITAAPLGSPLLQRPPSQHNGILQRPPMLPRNSYLQRPPINGISVGNAIISSASIGGIGLSDRSVDGRADSSIGYLTSPILNSLPDLNH